MSKRILTRKDLHDLPTLVEAVKQGDIDSIRRLLQWGVSVRETAPGTGMTSVHIACEKNLPTVVEILLRKDPGAGNLVDRFDLAFELFGC